MPDEFFVLCMIFKMWTLGAQVVKAVKDPLELSEGSRTSRVAGWPETIPAFDIF